MINKFIFGLFLVSVSLLGTGCLAQPTTELEEESADLQIEEAGQGSLQIE